MKRLVVMSFIFFSLSTQVFSVIIPNPKISGGKTVFTSKGSTTYLTDNKFNSNPWNVSNNSWIAIPVGSGSSMIFFNWNNPSYAWSNELSPSKCPNTILFPIDYNLLISSNSTNGEDGDWEIADTVRNNIVCSRGHLIDFTGASWVKMQIIKGGGQIDEIQVFDASKGNEDVWFFAGTSISANAFKGTPPAKNFADLVTEKHADYNPAMIRGGIGCISSSDFVGNLSKYLKMAGNAHFWAIEMGTNDAWGGTNGNVTTFKNNLQKVIDSCKVAGIQPIIAKVLATNETLAGWQVHSDFQKAIDDLTAKNNLIAGPDFYTWFLANPGDLNSDGVHPNATGAANIQRLWAEKMDSLYGSCSSNVIAP
jgi:lysophospholipase L1-like esterase